ncbi:MAG: hypothetical protein ACOX9C_04450 [Kiritimatiellia bacterium]|jgi:hypothetical protein
MILSVFLKFDSAAFTKGVGAAMEAVKGVIRLGGEATGKLKEAFDLGGAISDLAEITGEGAGDLLVLRQAFEDTGVGGDKLSQTLAIMRRNLADLSGGGAKGEVFAQMGLDIQALQQMGAEDQLETIGRAIRAMDNPTRQTAAAMEIFGRSGTGMLAFLKDDAAIDTARDSLGSLVGIIDKNAYAFDAISDRIGRLKMKSVGLWAGLAEGLTPLIDQITGMFDRIDFAGWARKVGAVIGSIVEMFRQNSIGEILAAGLDAAWTGFLNLAAAGIRKLGSLLASTLHSMGQWISSAFESVVEFFRNDTLFTDLGNMIVGGIKSAWGGFIDTAGRSLLHLGNILVTAFERPLAWISAAFQKAIEEVMEALGSIPGVGEALGLSGFKAGSFDSMYQDQLEQRQAANKLLADFLVDWKPFTAEVGEETASMWEKAVAGFRSRIADIQAAAGGGGGGAGGGGSGGGGAFKGVASAFGMPTDRLARIGGFVGGAVPAAEARRNTMIERIVENTRKTSELLARNATRGPVAAWG